MQIKDRSCDGLKPFTLSGRFYGTTWRSEVGSAYVTYTSDIRGAYLDSIIREQNHYSPKEQTRVAGHGTPRLSVKSSYSTASAPTDPNFTPSLSLTRLISRCLAPIGSGSTAALSLNTCTSLYVQNQASTPSTGPFVIAKPLTFFHP
ncbi:unnamed protein product [Protopolystoma xenopodis]|uniref:Uncharacterized protein n=1 Tax=Protopolystoma xenopodis TaxID=117903 RepID=A0A448X8Y0_9PLAT|nr:unnamed protein product [Protopolystoma xenopodis]